MKKQEGLVSNKKTTKRKKCEILVLHEKGLSLVKIAKALNMSRSTVGYHAHALIKKEHSEEFTNQIKKILELRSQGLKNKEIAEKLGLSFRKLYHLITKGNIGNRPRKLMPLDKITDLFKKGKKVQEIAEKLGFSRDAIRLTLHKIGLTQPKIRTSRKPTSPKELKDSSL